MKITDIANVPDEVSIISPSGYSYRWCKGYLGPYHPSRRDITGDWKFEREPKEKPVMITKKDFWNVFSLYRSGAISDQTLLERLGFE
jgi:hypothetical protein